MHSSQYDSRYCSVPISPSKIVFSPAPNQDLPSIILKIDGLCHTLDNKVTTYLAAHSGQYPEVNIHIVHKKKLRIDLLHCGILHLDDSSLRVIGELSVASLANLIRNEYEIRTDKSITKEIREREIANPFLTRFRIILED